MKWANKKQIILMFTMLHLKKKKTKNKKTPTYHYQNLDDMIYSSWDKEQNKLKLVILGHFLPFIPLKPSKIKILKYEKICWRYHHFTHVHQKSQSYDVWFLRYRVRPPQPLHNNPEYQNFEKNEKDTWRYYPFIHPCAP